MMNRSFKKLVIILLVLNPLLGFSQKINYTNFYPVENMPAKLLPKKNKPIGFLFTAEYDTCAWGYQISDGKYKVIAKPGAEFKGFFGVDISAYYQNDTVVFWSRYPWHASMSIKYYSWNGKKLIYLSEEFYDPSMEAMDKANEAMKRGDFLEASNQYMMVQYPMSYMDETMVAIELLSTAHQWGLRAFKEKNYSKSVEYLQGALAYYINQSLMEAEDEASYESYLESAQLKECCKDSIGLWLGDYGYFLYKADSIDKSIEVNSYLNTVYPQLSGPYLQLGDALFDQGKPKAAKSIYLKYIALMKEKGKEKSIPQRVHDRVK